MPLWMLVVAGIAADSAGSAKIAVAPAESLHVVRIGTGAPVVLIPGFFGSTLGFAKLIPLLSAAGYQSIIVEPLGTGFSGRPAHADYSLSAQANRVAAVMDSLHIRLAPIIAHSVGGAIALRLAYRRPDLVRALVSLEGGPTERVATPEFRRAARYVPWIKIFGGIGLIRHQVRRTLIASSGDTSWVTDGLVYGFTAGAAADLNGTLKAFVAMANSREPVRLEPHLHEIECPVRLVLGGAPHDGGVEPAEVTELRRTLDTFSVDSVPGVGHYVQEERPEAIVAALAKAQASARSAAQR